MTTRDKFEFYVMGENKLGITLDRDRNDESKYLNLYLEVAWRAWQACAELENKQSLMYEKVKKNMTVYGSNYTLPLKCSVQDVSGLSQAEFEDQFEKDLERLTLTED